MFDKILIGEYMMKKYIELLRIKHWLKNLLVFLPLFFSGNIFNKNLLIYNIVAFFIFSLASSIVYIINDICDINNDINHPIKKNRPLASGEVSLEDAIVILFFFLILVLSASVYLYTIIDSIFVVLIPLVYIIINIYYSKGLKNIAIIDVLILVFGFVLRVMYGSVVVNIDTSNYLYLMIIFGSYFLSFGKRRGEVIKNSSKSRKVLSIYSKEFLDKNMYVAYTLSIVAYTLWCMSIDNNYVFLTIPIIMTIMQLYSLNVEKDSYGDPVDVILSDKLLLITGIVYVIIMILILYI